VSSRKNPVLPISISFEIEYSFIMIHDNTTGVTLQGGKAVLVPWSENYVTGIKVVDEQHMELVNLLNELYRACLTNEQRTDAVFKEVMGRMVEYVRFHFSAELKILERINFPDYHEHKKQHDQLVVQILEAAKAYHEGRRYIANNFVHELKDWVLGHIGVYDQAYAIYVADQRKRGLLTDIEFSN
jgi:hemerythrin